MSFLLDPTTIDEIMNIWEQDYDIYAPTLFKGAGRFADTDIVRYGIVHQFSDIVFTKKSAYSFKEVLLPISQTLFFFTENEVKESDHKPKQSILFLRACDFHALTRLDDIYLKNGFEDFYYKRLRQHLKLVLLPCEQAFENCFCTTLGTNQTEQYDCSIEVKDNSVFIDNQNPDWQELFTTVSKGTIDILPSYVKAAENDCQFPETIPADIKSSPIWSEYDSRCIGCGRCTFVCPTCTCFTMQDIFYRDSEKAGERRRVWASCMVDGFTDMAGNISFRKNQGERMRFRILHKIANHRNRTGHSMCIGCGRCEDICPEYISFANCIDKITNQTEGGNF